MKPSLYYRPMHIGQNIQAWRLSKQQSVESLSDLAGIPAALLEQIESEQADPSAATIQALATALHVPPAWLFDSPHSFDCLFKRSDDSEEPASSPIDPVTDRILAGSHMDRSLYVLLTALMQAGDPKLLRAAEMSLRSLVKQTRQTSVPWQQRPSGHFEPPSD
ncbi:MAG: helix-turn-helix domain-containing protein [Nitrospiraceae bacterium]